MKRSCVPSVVRACSGLSTVFVLACAPNVDLGELASSTGETDASSATEGPGYEGNGEQNGSSSSSDDDDEPIDCMGNGPWPCGSDPDQDNLPLPCDNAPDRSNPSQSDLDGDGIADVEDLCPPLATAIANTADSDKDGIGNDCDTCRALPEIYNAGAFEAGVPAEYQVRNIPDVGDADGDGIGDACDNCVVVANCEDWNPGNPWRLGEPQASGASCQLDDDADLVGDACEGVQIAGAAGPVGFAPDDDFDQDGLTNAVDGCVRLPLPERIACSADEACPSGSTCEIELGVCNHPDIDADLVGDACDTCAFAPNPEQTQDGGQQEDDEDGDFVGLACETPGCNIFSDPRPMAFYSRAGSGLCCTVQLVEQDGELVRAATGSALRTPDGVPVRLDCSAVDHAAGICVPLPDAVAETPGVLTLPLGCDGIAGELVAPDEANLDAWWTLRCELPPADEDFDGIAEDCDLCPFSFDPTNEIYIDASDRVWPADGKYCNGEYSIDQICEQ